MDRCRAGAFRVISRRAPPLTTLDISGHDTLDGLGQVPSALPENELDRFIHHIAHDVRGSIRGLSRIPDWISEDLEEAGLNPPQGVVENLRFLKSRALRLDRMLQDLLTYSKVGRSTENQVVDVADILEQTLETVDVPRGFEFLGGFQSAKIEGTAEDVKILFHAVLSNAIKHHDLKDGTITLSSEVGETAVTLSISDDGPGIDPDDREKIFAPMSTLKSRDEAEGSGMGLAIASKIVDHLGGTIQVISLTAARGTELRLTFPCLGADAGKSDRS
jgi:signal transduction histidine kinase